MNDTHLPFERKPGESDFLWAHRVRSYIAKNAPKEHRYFVRNGKPGAKGQRWFIPGMLLALSIFFAYAGYVMGADVRTLNGSNGALGQFTIEHLQQEYSKRSETPKLLPVVTVRGERIIPLLSKPSQNHYQVGDVVTLRYSQTGDVTAAFVNENGEVSNGGPVALWIIAAIVGSAAILVARFYRGAVDNQYIDSEFERLTRLSTPNTEPEN